jgi:cysteinyl-tRNA synthetase
MAQHYLGDTLDLHCGGVDLIFPHHEDEIAQSEAATGTPFARVWLHGEFLMVSGTKMSKRYGNFLTARDLRESGVDAAAVRYLFGQTHYRKQLDWSDDALAGAAAGVRRLGEFRTRLGVGAGAAGESAEWREAVGALERRFTEAMDDDLNVPAALAAVMEFVRAGNGLIDRSGGVSVLAAPMFDRVTAVLQVVPVIHDQSPGGSVQPGTGSLSVTGFAPEVLVVPPEVRGLAEARKDARSRKDWQRADDLRKLLIEKGFDVRDTKVGDYELRRINRGPG